MQTKPEINQVCRLGSEIVRVIGYNRGTYSSDYVYVQFVETPVYCTCTPITLLTEFEG